MRDRLIEILREPIPVIKGYDVVGESRMSIVDAERYADRILANSVIVLPCKVGDTVYQPGYKFTKCSAYDYAPRFIEDSSCCGCEAKCDSVKEPYIYEGTVVSIRITKEQNFIAVSFQEKFDHSSFIIGKTVFLTREEAEQALDRALSRCEQPHS